MSCRFLMFGALALWLALESPLEAQYPPGGYPPGGYPPGGSYPRNRLPGGGLPMPRRGKKSKTTDKTQEQQLQSLSGQLRQLDDKVVIIEARDNRIITFKRFDKTKFLKNGDEMKSAELKPGDHVTIEGWQDDEGYFFAVNVIWDKEGTAAERAQAASEPVEASNQASANNDDERPILRRAGPPREPAAPDAPALPSEPKAPSTPSAPATHPAPSAPSAGPVAPPEPSAARTDPLVEVIPLPPGAAQEPIDESDDGPPRLRRGKPPARKPAAAPRQVASAAPPASAAPSAGSGPSAARIPLPAPSSSPEPAPAAEARRPDTPAVSASPPDPVIEKTRAEIASFTQSLPNYVCKEQIARFVNTSHKVDWRAIDVVSTELVYENGRESYRNLTVNGKPVQKKIEELSGAWSTGEFATVLVDVFSPATAADFRFRRESQNGGRTSLRYDFDVDRENSHWHIQVPSQAVLPAYRGSVWIDKETKRVLRIEMQARNMPADFPMDRVESATDYEYVFIGERKFLLPVHAETLMCQRDTNNCSRNVIDFRNYHKYAGEATITFDK